LFEGPFYDALTSEAKVRATTSAKLARLILVTVLSDDLVNAILDVPVGKAKAIAGYAPSARGAASTEAGTTAVDREHGAGARAATVGARRVTRMWGLVWAFRSGTFSRSLPVPGCRYAGLGLFCGTERSHWRTS
jgi:hypothetical protein